MSLEKARYFLENFSEAEMTVDEHRFFRFGSFLLDAAERELRRGDEVVPLTPKVFDTLVYLVRNDGHLVTKDELMTAVWPESFVDEANIARAIYTLRKVLGEDENGNQFIKTVPTKGYRFVAEVEKFLELPPGSSPRGQAHTAAEFTNGHTEIVPDITAPDLNLISRAVRQSKSRVVLWAAAGVLLAALVTGLSFESKRMAAPLSFSGLLHQTRSGKAYQFYQKARFFIERHQEEDFRAALENFDKAIALDPSYADAYAGRADAQIRVFWVSAATGDGAATAIDEISQAGAAIDKALELNGSSSYAHTILCRLKGTYYWQFAVAEKECKRAVELDPKDHEARRELAFLLNSISRPDEALSEIDNAVALAPTSYNKQSRGVILYFSRRYDEAIEQFEQVKETDPEFWFGVPFLLDAYEMKKDYPNALECYVRMKQVKAATAEEVDAIRAAFASGGWPKVLRIMANDPRPNRFQYAGTLAQLGEYDKALEVLNDLADRRQVWVVHAAREPRFDPLRNDPRFVELMRRIGLE